MDGKSSVEESSNPLLIGAFISTPVEVKPDEVISAGVAIPY